MTMPALHAAQALSAYRTIDATAPETASGGTDFASMLTRSLGSAVDLTSVVTAVSRAELALQTTVAVRDRVLQAYQDIIKMPI